MPINWTRIGRATNFAVQILTVFSGIAGLILFGDWLSNPSNRLVADIFPMEFRMPANTSAIAALAQQINKPMAPDVATIVSTGGANGFARIQLSNEGSLPIQDIHIHVLGIGVVYSKGTPNMNDSVIIHSDDVNGVTIPSLGQGSSITIYTWAGTVWGSYSDWSSLPDQFQITYSKGVAVKRFHIPVGTIAAWVDRNTILVIIGFGALFIMSLTGLAARFVRFRQDRQPGNIQIAFKSGAPYEVTDVKHQRILSTVRIGLLNSGATPIANCKVYVDKVSPEPPIPGGLPVLLEGGGFTLRHDEPERLIDVATHWNHVSQFRFNSSIGGGFSDSLMFIDDEPARTIVIKIEAMGVHERRASFRLWTDDSKALHLDHLGDVN
jgi:hypothetical protein